MPTYNIRCAEMGSPSCEREIPVDIPFDNLDEEQLAAISMGEPFEIKKENVGLSSPLSQEQRQALAQDGYTWVNDDYSETCDPCGCECEFDDEGNPTWN